MVWLKDVYRKVGFVKDRIFQFQYGLIKRWVYEYERNNRPDFNSNMVWLKVIVFEFTKKSEEDISIPIWFD